MRKSGVFIVGILATGLLVCATASTVMAQTRPAPLATVGDGLRLEMEWEAPVDLDLFVTGPAGETIYFGNKQSKNGDKLIEESNCESLTSKPSHLRETVLIPVAKNGKYRVSVDFIFQCKTDLEQADAKLTVFNVQTDTKLTQHIITVRRQVLKTVAMEFEVREK